MCNGLHQRTPVKTHSRKYVWNRPGQSLWQQAGPPVPIVSLTGGCMQLKAAFDGRSRFETGNSEVKPDLAPQVPGKEKGACDNCRNCHNTIMMVSMVLSVMLQRFSRKISAKAMENFLLKHKGEFNFCQS